MADRPKISFKNSPLDWLLELLSLITLCLQISIPLHYFNTIPDKIATHFNANGIPNAFSSSSTIWILPIISVLLYIGLSIIRRFPHRLNYPTKVTEENREKLYQVGRKTVLLLKTTITVSFCFITFKTAEISLGNSASLGKFFLPIFLGLILLILGNLVFKTVRKK